MNKTIQRQHVTEVRNRPSLYIPSTVRYLQKSRFSSELQHDGLTPKGLNLSIITLCAFYLEGCFESGISTLHELNPTGINLEARLRRATSPIGYKGLFHEVTQKDIVLLVGQPHWEDFTQLENIRGALAHGRAIVAQALRSVYTNGEDKFENDFNGSYLDTFKYLKKRRVIKGSAESSAFKLADTFLENDVADHFANVVPTFTEKFRAALVGIDPRAGNALSDDASLWRGNQ
jgi:hypothetical protein